jgi:FkbM family methyltransferase
MVDRVLKHRLVEPQIALFLRSRLVDRPSQFLLSELRGRPTRRTYVVRETGQRVLIQHGSADVHALDQSFYQHSHEPPAPALAALEALGRPLRALDVGANVGMWGLWFLARFAGATVVGLEPDPANVARHQEQIRINGLEHRWEIRQQAATVANGMLSFVASGTNGHISSGSEPGSVTVSGVDVFSLLDGIDLLKIDIEGGEWPIVTDPRFRDVTVPVVMLEYHPDGAPGDPGAVGRAALERAGFTPVLAADGPPGFGTWWGYRA